MAFTWTPSSKRLVALGGIIASGGLMMALASILEPPSLGQAAARSTTPASGPS
jgi:hypothetical protein